MLQLYCSDTEIVSVHTRQSAAPAFSRGRFELVVGLTLLLLGLNVSSVNALANESPESPEMYRANNGLLLPTLGNDAETDKVLLREVTDTHVFAPEVPTSTTQVPKATEDAASIEQSLTVSEAQTVWDVIRASEAIPHNASDQLDQQRNKYLEDAWWVNKTLVRSTPYLHFITQRLAERHLPLDLALIPAVESGYQPYASSAVSALGLWQIVPITAKEIGMKRNTWFDERGDLVQSTRAALDYLSYLNAEFNGDWELTLAAYNAGPGRVKSAIRKNRKANKPVDFWSLDLPPETQAYVPKLLALSELIREKPESRLKLPAIPLESTFETIDLGTRISLDKASSLAGVPEESLRNLNAGLTHAVTPPKGPHKIRVPARAAQRLKRAIKKAGSNANLFSLPRIHVVQSGDTLGGIALQYGISQNQLKKMNNLSSSKILLGQKLAVLDAKAGQMSTNDDGSIFSYTIQRGDTLSEIAERFNVKMADISFISGKNTRNRVLIPGQKLKIQVRSLGGSG